MFFQPYGNTEKYRILLERCVNSIVDFRGFQSAERGKVVKKPEIGLYDDIAAMFPRC